MSNFEPKKSSDMRQLVTGVRNLSDYFIHFVCGIFNDAQNFTLCCVRNQDSGEWWIGKVVEGRGRCLHGNISWIVIFN
jgi:hypothetical protein